MTKKQGTVSPGFAWLYHTPCNTVTEGCRLQKVTAFSAWYWVTKTYVSGSMRLTGRQMLAAPYCLFEGCFGRVKEATGRHTIIKSFTSERAKQSQAGWASWSKPPCAVDTHRGPFPLWTLSQSPVWQHGNLFTHTNQADCGGRHQPVGVWQSVHSFGCPTYSQIPFISTCR